jgi:hypothetical protein
MGMDLYGIIMLSEGQRDRTLFLQWPLRCQFLSQVLYFLILVSLFYSWIMQGLADTMDYLKANHQSIKYQMYTYLQYILGLSFIMLLLVLIFNGINASGREDNNWIDQQWRCK